MSNFIKMEDAAIDNLYLALIQCFAIILCGYVAGRFNMISKLEANGLNTFVGTFALPSLIFMSLAKLDFTLVNWKFLLAVLLAKSCVFVVVLGVTMVIAKPLNPGRAALFAIFTTQSNDFAIGYPMIDALYKETHPEYAAYLYLMVPISLAILNPIGFILLEIGRGRSQEHGTCFTMFYSIVKGVILNPVLFMTLFGIVGNLVFSHNVPPFLTAILEVFGNGFSATALFLLGLMMVGKVHKLKGVALVIPGILISIKLLVLPILIRESIIFLNAGNNATGTKDLSTYGFLYGTIPTAPALFIFTLRYNLEIDLIASAMVACTFLSAPLVFISAKVINAVGTDVTPASYAHQLNIFAFDISAVSIAACIWLLICFTALERKKYKSVTHRCTLFLLISQLSTTIGVILWTKLEASATRSILWYIQFILITTGVYASRVWTVAIAATLLFISCQPLQVVQSMHKWFLPVAWGIPLLIVILCLIVVPSEPLEQNFMNPNFQLGKIQAAISTFMLVFCFIVTIGFLILQQRYQRRLTSVSYANLIATTENSLGDNTGTNVVDVEDLGSPLVNAPVCNLQNDCRNGLCGVSAGQDNICDDNDADVNEIHTENPQTLRHLILLIFLLCSMFIGLCLSIGILITEQLTGVYAELAFLDVALNFGQSLIVFAIFGLDTGFGKIGCWVQRVCYNWNQILVGKEVQLPNEDALSPEIIAIREQFNRCHLSECRARIAICRRRMLKVHRAVFSGQDLVDWLLEAGLVHNREEGVHYGRCLLESRVLRHIDGTQHFSDTNFLYVFIA